MTALVGTLVEAWDELRVHKLRVLLSLIGAAAAVMAITGVTAVVQMLSQAMIEQSEQSGGRDTTLEVSAYSMTDVSDSSSATAAIQAAIDRYGIEYASRNTWSQLTIELPGGAQSVDGQAVDLDYGIIHRTVPPDGRWFTEQDAGRLAPTLVVNQAFMDRIGATEVSGHPTVTLRGDVPVTAEIIGVQPVSWAGEMPSFYILQDQVDRWGLAGNEDWTTPVFELWVPPAEADELAGRLQVELAAAMPGWQVDVFPHEGSTGVLDQASRWVMLAVSGFALLLGGLGLVNIALVTIRHRIREIGIRRSFGATSGRVFFGVLMESVVATVFAGAVGVAVAVVAIDRLPLDRLMGMTVQDIPPFPVSAALTGLACAAGIGALAGLLPAAFAVRVKVIDAIRY